MATLTIKIDSDDLAREVLTHLGYLPEDDDVPDLVTDVEEEPVAKEPEEEKDCNFIDALKTWSKHEIGVEETPRVPKTHMEVIADHMTQFGRPKSSRHEYNYKYDGAFCTTEEPKEGVEPVENENGMTGASLTEVFTEEAAKERDELYQKSLEVRKTIPPAEERLKTQIDGLMGGDILDYLATMADHDDPAMRKAVKAYVIEHYTGHNLRLWPALQKILEGNA